MRTTAKVFKITLFIDRNSLIRNTTQNGLLQIILSKFFNRFRFADLIFFDLILFLDEFFHLLFDFFEILFADLLFYSKVIIETLIHYWTDKELCIWIEFFDRLCHQVCCRVPDDFECLCAIVKRDDVFWRTILRRSLCVYDIPITVKIGNYFLFQMKFLKLKSAPSSGEISAIIPYFS